MGRFAQRLLLAATLSVAASAGHATAGIQAITLDFYSERVSVAYNTDIVLPFHGTINEQNLVNYYQQIKRRDDHTLLRDLDQHRRAYELNDWLFYELLRATVDEILEGGTAIERELTTWFLLAQLGFDARLTFYENGVFLYVYTEDEVFEVPMIEDGGRHYVNLSSIHRPADENRPLYLLNFAPRPQGRPFTFYLQQLPKLRPQVATRSFQFAFEEYVYQVEVEADQTVVEVMREYPFIAEQQYLEVPLSTSVSSSLIPQFRRMLHGKTKREALAFLVAFTRSSFLYKDDKEHFGHSKPMIADEVFHYPYSDCEDRSALFYRLVRDLLDLPMIVVAYEDHLTIAVALDGAPDDPDALPFDGRRYYICDPTGPVNSTAIGRAPKGYEQAAFTVIGRYK